MKQLYNLLPFDNITYKMLEEIKNDFIKNNIEIHSYFFNIFIANITSIFDLNEAIDKTKKCILFKNQVKNSVFWIYSKSNKKIVGWFDIRHHLNEKLYNGGGHIGYEIIPSYRNQKIISKLFPIILSWCKKNINSYRVMICCKSNNIPSKKIILKFNGKLIDSTWDDDGNYCERYWIYL